MRGAPQRGFACAIVRISGAIFTDILDFAREFSPFKVAKHPKQLDYIIQLRRNLPLRIL